MNAAGITGWSAWTTLRKAAFNDEYVVDDICSAGYIRVVRWRVEFHDAFEPEFWALAEAVRIELAARVRLLAEFGPALGRPSVDTLKGSRIANLKEVRFDAEGGVWRVLFAFDGRRVAILLAAGDKRGAQQARFYRTLIAKAERRWER